MTNEKLTKIEDGVWQTPDGRFRVEAADNVRLFGYTLIDTQRWTWGYVGPRLPYGPRNVDMNPDTLAEARELIAKRRDCAEDEWGYLTSPTCDLINRNCLAIRSHPTYSPPIGNVQRREGTGMTGLEMYERRRVLGQSQQHLAAILGVSRMTLSTAENGGSASPGLLARADTYLSHIEQAHSLAVKALVA